MTQASAAMMGLGSCTNSVASLNLHKFTGKERDAESGLDYFIHRHYANTMGRFMQPDDDSAQ